MILCHASRIVYENRWMRVREDSVEFPNGTRGLYGVVEKPDFAAIVPVDADGRIHLVEQYRYPVAGRFWEIPQGTLEGDPGAAPGEVAVAELREETGLEAARLTYLGLIYEACGYSSQGCHLFVATGLTTHPPAPGSTESDLVAQPFPVAEIRRMIVGGRIRDATTIAAMGYLALCSDFGYLFEKA